MKNKFYCYIFSIEFLLFPINSSKAPLLSLVRNRFSVSRYLNIVSSLELLSMYQPFPVRTSPAIASCIQHGRLRYAYRKARPFSQSHRLDHGTPQSNYIIRLPSQRCLGNLPMARPRKTQPIRASGLYAEIEGSCLRKQTRPTVL